MYTHCIFLFHIIQKSTDILEILAHICMYLNEFQIEYHFDCQFDVNVCHFLLYSANRDKKM